MNWENVFSGKIWAVQQSVQRDGRVFEKAVRAPGSRVILYKDGKVLLQKEKRHELGGKVDKRLPGGKVFDNLDEFKKYSGNIEEASRESIAKETLEETGYLVKTESLTLLYVDKLGATCEWDLYYWLATDFTLNDLGADFHETEADEIEGHEWVELLKLKDIVMDDELFSESRSALALTRFINKEMHI